MSDDLRCPDCGRVNEAGASECVHCGFPLRGTLGTPPAVAPTNAGGEPPPGRPAAAAPMVVPRPLRPRPRPRRTDSTAVSLWLVFGTIAALVMVWIAIKANVEHPKPPVEGATPLQQVYADSVLAVVQRDSTLIEARNALADVLYDTANWPDAIVQYRATIRMDSTRVPAIVDLGVCYFNLSDSEDAEKLFRLAVSRDPHQPVALFNLGILYESRKDWKEALRYYHEAMQSNPPPSMQKPLVEHMTSAMKQVGAQAGTR